VELACVFQEVAAPVSTRVVYDAHVVSGWVRSNDVLPERVALFAVVDFLVSKATSLHSTSIEIYSPQLLLLSNLGRLDD